MMKFTVNLARRPAENLRRAWVVWGGMLAVLSAILFILASGTLVSAWNNRRMHRQQAEVEHRMEPLRRREQILDRQLQDPAVHAALSRSQYLNTLIDRKSVSWTRLFERLEKLMPDDLRLISIHPQQQAGKSGVVMVVGSSTLQPAIDFVGNLEKAPDFSSAQVKREARSSGDAERPAEVRVEIEALYQPPVSDLATAEAKPAEVHPAAPANPSAATAQLAKPHAAGGNSHARRTR